MMVLRFLCSGTPLKMGAVCCSSIDILQKMEYTVFVAMQVHIDQQNVFFDADHP